MTYIKVWLTTCVTTQDIAIVPAFMYLNGDFWDYSTMLSINRMLLGNLYSDTPPHLFQRPSHSSEVSIVLFGMKSELRPRGQLQAFCDCCFTEMSLDRTLKCSKLLPHLRVNFLSLWKEYCMTPWHFHLLPVQCYLCISGHCQHLRKSYLFSPPLWELWGRRNRIRANTQIIFF